MKKSLSLLVAIAMVFSMFATVVSADTTKSAGEKLKEAGIITGTSEGLQEGAEWLRKDVAVIISRLAGAEAEAKAFTGAHGFTDLNSSFYGPIVAWAKAEGYVNGTTETTFSPNSPVTNLQFAALVLRVLGQDEGVEYADSLTKAIELGLFASGTEGSANAVRGNIYSVIDATLNTVVDGQKLGTKLGLKGYEVTALAIASAKAVVASEIVVSFNDELVAVEPVDVKVADADNNEVIINSIAIDGKNAVIKLADGISGGKEYTVTIDKATAKTATALANGSVKVTYNKGVPASVSFPSDKVLEGKTVKYLVKDAQGNDITADFGLEDNFTVASSNTAVINLDLEATGTSGQYSVLSLTYIDNESVTTGNVNIFVDEVDAIKIEDFELDADDNVLFLKANKAASDAAATSFDLKNSDGDTLTAVPADTTYKSSRPSVAVVDEDGNVTGVSVGTATITVTTKYDGKTTNATLTVEVKEQRKLASLELSKSTVTIAKDATSDVVEKVKVTAKDQYGKGIELADASTDGVDGQLQFSIKDAQSKVDLNVIASGSTSGTEDTNDKGEFEVELTGATSTGSFVVTVKALDENGNVISSVKEQKLTVKIVDKAQFKGYVAEVSSAKIDSNNTGAASADQFDPNASVTVYEVDKNNNKIAVVDATYVSLDTKGSESLISASGSTITPEANAVGTAKFKVLVEDVVISTLSIEVAPSAPKFVTEIKQVKKAIKIDSEDSASSVEAKVFGKDGAITFANAKGDNVSLADAQAANVDITIFTNKASLLPTTLDPVDGQSGVATLTIVINGSVFTLEVTVTE